jgi:hypothetical protein
MNIIISTIHQQAIYIDKTRKKKLSKVKVRMQSIDLQPFLKFKKLRNLRKNIISTLR